MLSTLEMRIKVLQIYLTEYMRKLTPASSSFGNISRIVVDIQHIFESQAQRFIFPKDSCSHVIENIDSNAMKSLRKVTTIVLVCIREVIKISCMYRLSAGISLAVKSVLKNPLCYLKFQQ